MEERPSEQPARPSSRFSFGKEEQELNVTRVESTLAPTEQINTNTIVLDNDLGDGLHDNPYQEHNLRDLRDP